MIEKKNLLTDQQVHLLDDFIPDEQDLSEEAKEIFPYHTNILRTFELHRNTVLKNTHITPIGRHLCFTDMAGLFRTYQSVLNYIASNQNILRIPRIDRSIIIIGLPRTGSTLLFNLLACDTNSRAPYLTDMMANCLPPIPRSDVTHRTERLIEVKGIIQDREKILSRKYSMAASHPVYLIEEDYYILRHVGFSMLFFMHSFDHPCESEKWLFDENDADARKAANEFGSRFIYKMAERIVKFRSQSSSSVPKHIVDIAYEDLMKSPIETVRKIYEYFGLSYSTEFEVAMQRWLHDNPQGKQGRHAYHLSDVNLTSEKIQQCYADYIDRFRFYLSERTSN